ncbi:MAG: tRNA (adenosine(37)-N6)-threonylcarbamoyltransferase complex transferase subunit TsaD [Selenomonadaceae bacterium]|nr:tRNA (adenosine(37)-N6)-threonylcarbamoyltransferase complex transferase subunit TsaD [Selenomonadaceae bacterium]
MDKKILTLGIETSCDETAAAVLRDGREILSNVISTQIPLHQKFGGVVPEIASRKHIVNIMPVIDEAINKSGVQLSEINQIAVTYGPGLVGALLVGVSAAKTLAFALKIPLVAVNHLEGHIFANFLSSPELTPPFLALVVSGGHTALIKMNDYNAFELLGQTRDDAAGEAFDKIARVMNLPYPGGPEIDKLAKIGNADAIDFPRPKVSEFDFSFSGLKSSVLNHLNSAHMKGETVNNADVAASFQKAVVDSLIEKTVDAAGNFNLKKIVLAGGVAANSSLEKNLRAVCESHGLEFFYPSKILCTDNAAMIACRGYYQSLKKDFAPLTLNAVPNLTFEGVKK